MTLSLSIKAKKSKPLSSVLLKIKKKEKANNILACINRSITCKSKEMIIYSALVRPSQKSDVQFWALLFKTEIDILGNWEVFSRSQEKLLEV